MSPRWLRRLRALVFSLGLSLAGCSAQASETFIPSCSGAYEAICVYSEATPIDEWMVEAADNVAMPGDFRVDCDAPNIYCDDEGA